MNKQMLYNISFLKPVCERKESTDSTEACRGKRESKLKWTNVVDEDW
jgi:hypothetical protein